MLGYRLTGDFPREFARSRRELRHADTGGDGTNDAPYRAMPLAPNGTKQLSHGCTTGGGSYSGSDRQGQSNPPSEVLVKA